MDVIAGSALVAPIPGPAPRAADRASLTIALSDGRTLAHTITRFDAALGDLSLGATPIERWMAPIRQWTVSDGRRAAPEGAASAWAAVIEIPADARGLDLKWDGRPLHTRWISPPTSEVARDASGLWTATDLAAVERLCDTLERQPSERWRARVIRERLGLGAADDVELAREIEALADQHEARWRVAWARLAEVDPSLALEVIRRLTLVVRFGEGVVAPAWPVEEEATAALQTDLLDPRADGAARRIIAQEWLEERPRALFWTMDDHGRGPEGAPPYITVGVAEAIGQPSTAWLEVRQRERTPATTLATPSARETTLARGLRAPLAPYRASALIAPSAGAYARPAPYVMAVVDRLHRRVRALSAPALAAPPGLTLGPTFAEWTHARWALDAPAMDVDHAVVGLLRRRLEEPGWEIYLECRASAKDSPVEDVVTLHVGPRARMRQIVLRAPPAEPRDTTVERADHVARREQDRWIAIAPIPEALIEPPGLVRVGIVRVVAGARLSWPRPMLPWQSEPGRVAVELGAWNELELAPDSN